MTVTDAEVEAIARAMYEEQRKECPSWSTWDHLPMDSKNSARHSWLRLARSAARARPAPAAEGKVHADKDAEIDRILGKWESTIAEKEHAKNERLRAALGSCASWIERWTQHAGACKGGDRCTCGRTAVLYETGEALNGTEQLPQKQEE